jgi:large subunit ribosomal protein L13Ae
MVSGSGVCARVVVVDARHHMLGRLASIVAKELLNGQRVVSISLSVFSFPTCI